MKLTKNYHPDINDKKFQMRYQEITEAYSQIKKQIDEKGVLIVGQIRSKGSSP